MATGKYSRVDGRKTSSYCSTMSIVVVVAVCLVGVWMLMSSSAGPTRTLEFSEEETTQAMPKSVSKKLSGQDDVEEGKYESTTESVDKTEDKLEGKKAVEYTDESTQTEAAAKENQDADNSKETSDEKNESQEGQKFEDQNGNQDEESGETQKQSSEMNMNGQNESAENSGDSRSDSVTSEENMNKNSDETVNNNTIESEEKEAASNESSESEQSEISNESTSVNGVWSTQRVESQNEKKMQTSSSSVDQSTYEWKLCNVTAGPDYIPCLDNLQAIKKSSRRHYEHRERHCPDEAPTCLVPLPEGYRRSLKWPTSRDKIWYYNVPHTKLAEVKGHQNWVKVTGEYLTFPGGGTQFIHGALHYIDFIRDSFPEIAWGKRSRVILDVGCGVASFGGYLFERDVLAMSFAPKDEHEAQVQFALERGIPAISNVMGTKRLPFPGYVFDIVHCARCRVPWQAEGGKLLLELNRVLRPGGFFVWSATPVYQNLPEDVEIWKAMSKLTKAMCWEMVAVKNDKLNSVGAAIYRKPTSNECYDNRPKNKPPLCEESDDPNAAWNVSLETCMHRVPVDPSVRGAVWPEQWPARLEKAPYWLSSQVGVYGKAAPEDFRADTKRWKTIVSKSYLNGMGIDWSSVRNVMDMRAVYGGFAAALKDLKLWVMNIVPIDSSDTLPIIYERGLFGIYHNWCESFNTYPRTYDLLHADHLFSNLKKRCKLVTVFAEIDRILRPEGKLIVRDNAKAVAEAESIAKSLQWEIQKVYTKDKEGVLCIQKTIWRPTEIETIYSAIA